MERYLIIVSRDRPELVETLRTFYAHLGEVEVRLDRRERQAGAWKGDGPDRRRVSHDNRDLQTEGFFIVQQG